ncbi:MAG TPA: sulfatase-like hydrolase/transferase [Bryobacteraceae bacterium]|nr:sulfatase-like hydrolase/transferase [Bryobacteraceae bacterium]
MPLSLSPRAREELTDLLICFSLGNLCFLRRWYDLEHLQSRSMDYFRTGPPDRTLLYSTLLCSALLTMVFWLLWNWAKRSGSQPLLKLARCGFLLIFMFPLESVRRYWNIEIGHVDWGSSAALLTIELLLAIGLGMTWTGNLRILSAARNVALAMVFLLPALLIDFFWSQGGEPVSVFQPKPSLPLLHARASSLGGPAPRLIWLLFDELDQRLAFNQRQPSVVLPELDRLRAESFAATHAFQTGGYTMVAIPSLLSGRIYTNADMADADTLMVRPEGSEQEFDWRNEPNVFRRARELGVNAAVVGWHHPYCRVLGDSLVRCFDKPSDPSPALLRETDAAEDGLLKTVGTQLSRLAVNFFDIFRPDADSVAERLKDASSQRRQQQQYFAIRDHAYQDAIDTQIDFLYVHFPTPHLFAIYDRQRQNFALSSGTTYFDNLALVDRTVGELRHKLEEAGLWDSTSILVTSDHGLRRELWHGHLNWTPVFDRLLENGSSPLVPFILRLAGSHEGVVYDQPFSSVVEGEMVLAVMKNQVSTPRQAAEWLTRHNAPPSDLSARRLAP